MSLLTRSDYLRIKWPVVALLGSLLLGGGIFGGLQLLDKAASADLQRARASFNDADERVVEIEQEEASVRANLEEFRRIETTNVLRVEDRLQMQEYFAELRAEHNLFPITLSQAEQKVLPIGYDELGDKEGNQRGRPVSLLISNLEFALPLLHENDLTNLLSGLAANPELLQLNRCVLTAGGSARNYVQLGQHFDAACTMAWYSFRIDEETKPAAKGRNR